MSSAHGKDHLPLLGPVEKSFNLPDCSCNYLRTLAPPGMFHTSRRTTLFRKLGSLLLDAQGYQAAKLRV